MTQKSTSKAKSTKRSRRSTGQPSPDDYQMVLLWSEEDQCYVVTLPAWQNARTHGATLEQAVRNAREVLEMLIESAIKHGEPVPPPDRRFSGNLRLRLPVSLHARLVLEAEREGVSLNQWIVSKLAG
jgi:predicted RNase H-like HicB family nuclease